MASIRFTSTCRLTVASAALLISFGGCSGDDSASATETTGSTSTEGTTTGGSSGSSAEASSEGSSSDASGSTSSGGESEGESEGSSTGVDPTGGGGFDDPLCRHAPPPGAELAAPLPTYAGACPIIETGYDLAEDEAGNVVMSSGAARRFAVIAPEDIGVDEALPVIFMWHWLGGSAKSFYERSDVQAAADLHRFIAVIPEAKGDTLFKWPFTVLESDARLEEEFVFFDDMLACVAEQFVVDHNCVSSTGVSAGALFTGQLAQGRSERLAAIMPLSGGVGGTVKPWNGAKHKMPAMVLWGGPEDFCVAVDFDAASKELEKGLASDGHFVVECVHNCAHSTPPFETPEELSTFAPLWMFALDHPYWLDTGSSPYVKGGLPVGYPEWCAVGVGAASIRVGECAGSEC